jgi:epoxyqueuosine reductase
MRLTEKSELIKAEALRLGFEACGISKAKKLDREAQFLEKWLSNGLHAAMHYMQNHFEKRVDPTKLVHGAKSVISVAMNYFPENEQKEKAAPVLSKYAYGTDYHFVLKDRLKTLLNLSMTELKRLPVGFLSILPRCWIEHGQQGQE